MSHWNICGNGPIPLHQESVVASTSSPTIKLTKLVVDFSRDSVNHQQINWTVSEIEHSADGANKFGYQFYAYIGFNGDPNIGGRILYKDAVNDGTSWRSHLYNSGTFSGSFLNTTGSTNVTVYVGQCTCKHSGGTAWCYPGVSGGKTPVYDQVWDTEPYETFTSLSYNMNGGTPQIGSQSKSSLSTLYLSTIVPTRQYRITYHNDTITTNYASMGFNNWLCNNGSKNPYVPGDSYDLNVDSVMTAQWANATFTPIALPTHYYEVTYDYKGGTGSPAKVQLARQSKGYSRNSQAQTASYEPGTSYVVSENLDLYPVYGDATLTSLPTPTREGSIFKGWYDGNTKVTTPYTITGNKTLTAKWIPLPIHIMQNGRWRDIGPNAYIYKNNAWTKSDLTGADATRNHIWKADSSHNWEDKSV